MMMMREIMLMILIFFVISIRGGDWDSLNNLLKDVVFAIPDPGTFTAGTFAWTDLKVTLTNIQVSKVSLVDLVLDDVVKTPGSGSSQREVDLTATLSSLEAHVNLDWKYKYGIISGSGKADASVTKGNAVVQMSVVSPNTDTPPSSATVLGCTMTLHLDATYSGGITASIADLFKSSVNSKLESVIEDEVCTELKSAGINALNGVLGNVTALMNPYLTPAPAPLNPDNVLKELVPDPKERAKLLNIQTHWAFRFLNDVISEIFAKKDDQGLLGLNEFVDGVTSGGNVSLQINTILLNSTNSLTTGMVTLTNLVITGLDTFTEADLYDATEPQVADTAIALRKLGYDIYLTINIQPSDAQGSIVHGGSGEIVENIRISGSFDSLALNATGLVGIDNATLNAITLGQLVEGGNASSCVAHAFRVANVTGAEASIVSVMQPVLSQFISKGLSDFLNAAAGAGMDLYLQTLLEALPNLVQEKFRDLLNQAIGKALAKAASASRCTDPKHPDGHWEAWENITLGQILLPLNLSTLNPLQAENTLLADSTTAQHKLVDLKTFFLTSYLNDLTTQLLAKSVPYGEGTELGINTITRGLLEDSKTGRMVLSDSTSQLFNLSNPLLHDTSFAVNMTNLTLGGLDTITAIDLTSTVPNGKDATFATQITIEDVSIEGVFSFTTTSYPCPRVCFDENAGKTEGCPMNFTDTNVKTIPETVYVLWSCDESTTCTIANANTEFWLAKSETCAISSLQDPKSYPDCLQDLGSSYVCMQGRDADGTRHTFSNITMKFTLEKLDLRVDTLLAIDENEMYNLRLGPLLDSSMACIASSVVNGGTKPSYAPGVALSVLNISTGSLKTPPVTGLPSGSENMALSQMLQIVQIFFRDILRDALPANGQNLLRPLLNEKIMEALYDGSWHGPWTATCPPVNETKWKNWTQMSNVSLGDMLVTPATTQDPLDAQKKVSAGTYPGIPKDATLDNFETDDLFLTIKRLTDQFLHTGDDANELIRDLTSGTGNVTIEMKNATLIDKFSTNVVLGGAEITILLDTLNLFKLDSFRTIHPLDTLGTQTVQSTLDIEEIGVTLDLVVQVADIIERVQVTSGLSDLNFTAAAMFAVDETKLDALTVGSLLENPLSCLESLLIVSEVTEAKLSLKNILPLTQKQDTWGKLENFGAALEDIFFAARLAIVDILLPHSEQIAQRLVKPILNDVLGQAISYASCPALPDNATSFQKVTWGSILGPAPEQDPLSVESAISSGTYEFPGGSGLPKGHNFVSFKGDSPFGDLLKSILSVFDTLFANTDTLMDGLTDGSGNVTFTVDSTIVSNATSPLAAGSEITFILNRVKLSGLDTFKHFDPFTFLGAMTVQTDLLIEEIGVEMEITLNLTTKDKKTSTSASTNISTSLHGFGIQLAAALAIDEHVLSSTEVGSVLSSPGSCLFLPVLALELTRTNVTLDKMDDILVGPWKGDDDKYTTNMIDDIVTAGQIVIDQLIANHFSSIASQLLQPFANTKLRDALSSKNTTACPACTNVCVTFEDIVSPVTHTEDPLNGERMLFECLEPGSKDPSLLPTGLSNFSKLPSGCDMIEAAALQKSGGGMKDMLDISNNTVMKLIQNALDNFVRGKDDQGNLKINDLMKKLMTSDNGTALNVALNGLAIVENATTPLMNSLPTSVYLDTLKLQNLDTFTAFDPLVMISNHTMQIRVSLSEVNVTLGLRVVVNGNQVNNMTVSTSLQGLDIEVALLLAAQTSKVDALMLGGLLHNATDCIGQVLVGAEFTAMDINITCLGTPVVVSTGSSPGSNPDVTQSLQALLSATAQLLDNVLLPHVRSFAYKLLGPLFNDKAENILISSRDEGKCPIPTRGTKDPALVDLSSSWVVSGIQKILKLVLGSNSTGINSKIIDPATKSQSGTPGVLYFPDPLFNFTVHWIFPEPMSGLIEDMGWLHGIANDVFIGGLDSVSRLDVLQPSSKDKQTLHTELTIGSAPNGPISALLRLLYSVTGGMRHLHALDDVKLGLNLTDAHILMDLALYIATERMWRLRMDQVSELECWLSTFSSELANETHGDAITFTNLDMDFAIANPSVDCMDTTEGGQGCTGEKWMEFEQYCRDPEKVNDASEEINRGVSWIMKKVALNMGGTLFADLVSNAPSKCCDSSGHSAPRANGDPTIHDKCNPAPAPTPAPGPSPPAPAPSPSIVDEVKTHPVIFWITVGASFLLVVLTVTWCVVRRKVRANRIVAAYERYKNNSDKVEPVTESRSKGLIMSDEDWIVVEAPTEYEDSELARELAGPSLFNHPSTPWIARYAIPVVLVGTMGMFLSGHVQDGAHVMIDILVAGEPLIYEWEAFSFSLGSSLGDMYNAGAYVLVFLIGGFSGVWPYLKCTLLLYSWFSPPWLFRPRQRGQTIQILDMMGKWSLIDVYVLILCQCAFRVSVKSPVNGLEIIPREFYDAEVMVLPVWGMFAFLLATACALVVNHFVIVIHRNAIADDTAVMEAFARMNTVDALESGDKKKMKKHNSNNNSLHKYSSANGMDLPSLQAIKTIDSLPSAHFDNEEDLDDVRLAPPTPSDDLSPPDGLGERQESRTRCKSSLAQALSRLKELENGSTLGRKMSLAVARKRVETSAVVKRLRSRTSFFGAGTDDVVGKRKMLVNIREALKDHVFDVDGEEFQVALNSRAQFAVLVLCILSAVMVAVGSILPSFEIEITGLVGIAEDFYKGSGSNVKQYSMWTIAFVVFEQAQYCHHPQEALGVGFMGVVYLLVSFFIPVVQLLSLAFMWYRPMTLKTQKQLFFVNEVLSAWSTVEVFIVGIVAALFELTSVSGFMADAIEQCGPIKSALKDYLVPLGIMDLDEAQCFSVLTRLRFGVYVLIGAAFMANIACQIVLRLCEASLESREDRIKGRKVEEELANGCGRFLVSKFNGMFQCCLIRIARDPSLRTERSIKALRRRSRKMSSNSYHVLPSPSEGGHIVPPRWRMPSVPESPKEEDSTESKNDSSGGEDDLLTTPQSTAGLLSPPVMNVSVRSLSNAPRVLPPQWTAIMSSKREKHPVLFWDQTSGETISMGGTADSESGEEDFEESKDIEEEKMSDLIKNKKDSLKQPLLSKE